MVIVWIFSDDDETPKSKETEESLRYKYTKLVNDTTAWIYAVILAYSIDEVLYLSEINYEDQRYLVMLTGNKIGKISFWTSLKMNSSQNDCWLCQKQNNCAGSIHLNSHVF